jgi:hypothetical protein
MKPQQAALLVAVGLSAHALVRIWLPDSPATDNAAQAPSLDRLATSLTADASALQHSPPQILQPVAFGKDDITPAGAPFLEEDHPGTVSQEPKLTALAMADPAAIEPVETAPEPAAKGSGDTRNSGAARSPVDTVEILDECFSADACIDRYLWALYQRTPKQDTVKQYEYRKVMVRKKRKMVSVTRTITTLVDEDFAWKDRKAAERAGISMMDYVVGGVDRSFKRKLFYMLHAAEKAGLSPGITSAFRDDYRQSIASGLKAADDRSYHGGSSRGGYGHGLAADVVSVKGETRAQRWVSTEAFWNWIDAHGKEFGIGRPYLDRDAPHVGPMDGKEYVSRRGGSKAEETSSRHRSAAHHHHATKHTKTARSSRARARAT